MHDAAATSFYTTLSVPATLTANTAFVLPSSNGTNGQVLTTDGSGNTSWAAAGLPSGTTNYTLRYSGSAWVSSGALTNDATNVATSGNMTVTGGSLITGAASSNLFNTVATTLNIGGASTTTNIGSTASGTTTIGYDLKVTGANLTTGATTANLFNTTATTLNIGGGATTAVNIGATTGGTTTINYNMKIGAPTLSHITAGAGTLAVKGDAEFNGALWINGATNCPSDERLKANIETLTNVLAKIEQIRGVSYVFKNQQKYAQGPQVGVIAQELKKVFPELVAEGADGYLAVNYTMLTAVVLQAVKEQQKEINLLKTQMTKVMQKLGMEQ